MGIAMARMAAAMGFLWVGLNGADPSAWIIAAPGCAVALFAGHKLGRDFRHRVRFLAVPGFARYFIASSWNGGIDIARRALDSARPLDPHIDVYRTRLPAGTPRAFFCITISLLPGTLVAAVDEDLLTIHFIGDSRQAESELRRLEDHTALLFGLETVGQSGDRS